MRTQEKSKSPNRIKPQIKSIIEPWTAENMQGIKDFDLNDPIQIFGKKVTFAKR
jgi:hypothetical protein